MMKHRLQSELQGKNGQNYTARIYIFQWKRRKNYNQDHYHHTGIWPEEQREAQMVQVCGRWKISVWKGQGVCAHEHVNYTTVLPCVLSALIFLSHQNTMHSFASPAPHWPISESGKIQMGSCLVKYKVVFRQCVSPTPCTQGQESITPKTWRYCRYDRLENPS